MYIYLFREEQEAPRKSFQMLCWNPNPHYSSPANVIITMTDQPCMNNNSVERQRSKREWKNNESREHRDDPWHRAESIEITRAQRQNDTDKMTTVFLDYVSFFIVSFFVSSLIYFCLALSGLGLCWSGLCWSGLCWSGLCWSGQTLTLTLTPTLTPNPNT